MTKTLFPVWMRRGLGPCLALLALSVLPGSAGALGLGPIKVKSFLNQPLKAEIWLIQAVEEDVSAATASVAPQEAFARVGLSRNAVINNMQFKVTGEGTPRSPARLLVTTTEVVKEPVLSFLVELDWPTGKVIREYTILLDPPVTPQTEARMAPQAPPQAVPTPLPGPSTAPAPYAPGSAEPVPAPGQPTRPIAPRAPVTAPPRSSAARPAPRPAASGRGQQYGPVAPQETLWSIAYKLRPDPRTITMDQMQIALLRANPRAFEGNNINRLIKGSILRVPSSDEIRAINPVTAKQQVRSQKQAFGGTRTTTARRSPAPTPAAQPAAEPVADSSEAEQPSTEPSLPEPPAESESAADGDTAADGADTSAEGGSAAAPVDEDTEATVAAMREQADAAAAASPESGTSAADTEDGSAVDGGGDAMVDEEPVDAAEAGQADAESGQPGEAGEPESIFDDGNAEVDAEDIDIAPATGTDNAQADAEAEDSGSEAVAWVGGAGTGSGLLTPLNIAGAAAILALIGGALWYNRKRRNKEAETEFDSILQQQSMEDVGASSEASAEPEATVAAAAPEAAEQPPGDDEAGDPDEVLSEVDMHMAYGLYEECENMLKPAIAANPARKDLKVKLLEVYQASGNTAQFESLAGEVKSELGEDSDDWRRVADMGRKLLPGAALFGAGAAAAASGGERAADQAADQATGQTSSDSDSAEASAQAAVREAMEQNSAAEESVSDADESFDAMLGESEAATESSSVPDEAEEFDFDALSKSLEGDDVPAAESSAEGAGTASAADSGSGDDSLDFNLEDLDFGLDEGSSGTGEEAAAPASETAADEGLSFDFDELETADQASADEPDATPAVSAADQAAEDTDMPDLAADDAGLDFEVSDSVADKATETAEEATAPAEDAVVTDTGANDFNASDEGASAGEPEPEDLGGSGGDEEMSTKLDLARAYIDMGEPSMAESLLQEVVAGGDGAQKSEAEELLKSVN